MSQTITNKYEIILKIGEGSSGIVYKAREIRNKNIITLKQYKNNQQALDEIEILNAVKGNPNIINLIGIEKDDSVDKFFIIYEYYEYSIYDLIYQNATMDLNQIKTYFKQMLLSIEALHSKGYIHRDIKPDNFLLSSNNEIMLIDFSVSIKNSDILKKDQSSSNIVGTRGYIAPELLLGSTDYGNEVDIWSLGCTFYEILTHEKLLRNKVSESDIAQQMITIFGFPSEEDFPNIKSFRNIKLFANNITTQTTTINTILDNKLKDEYKIFEPIIIGMLQMNPKSRIPLIEILQNPIFQDTEPLENLPRVNFKELSYYHDFDRKINVHQKNHKKKMNDFYTNMRLLKILPVINV